MAFVLELVVLALTLLFICLWKSTRRPSKFPPGPPRLPIIGSLPYIMGSVKEGMQPTMLHGVINNVEKYGPLVGMWIGHEPVVIVADLEKIKYLFKKDEVTARPDMSPFHKIRPGWETMRSEDQGLPPGIIFTHGKYWQDQRRFLLRTLRDFGFGKSSMEDLILEESEKLNKMIANKMLNYPVDLGQTFNVSVFNALWVIMVGEKFELDDPELKTIVETLQNYLKESDNLKPIISQILPKFVFNLPIFNNLHQIRLIKETIRQVSKIVESRMEAHLKTLDEDNIRDMLDHMLVQTRTSNPNSSFYGELGYYSILNNFLELFMAGMETSATTLKWLIYFMIYHPEVQEKVQEELDRVVGDQVPKLQDKDNLPYVNAVILEAHRLAVLAQFAVPHYTLSDIAIDKYVIPKGTTVMPSFYHVLCNPELFPDPDQFKPERFLNNGHYVNDERVIAFSVGKRQCPGQSLAEKELLLFFSGLLQKFKFKGDGSSLPSYRVKDMVTQSFIRNPPIFKTVIELRS